MASTKSKPKSESSPNVALEEGDVGDALSDEPPPPPPPPPDDAEKTPTAPAPPEPGEPIDIPSPLMDVPPPKKATGAVPKGKARYRVWPHGSLSLDGTTYSPGSTLDLDPLAAGTHRLVAGKVIAPVEPE